MYNALSGCIKDPGVCVHYVIWSPNGFIWNCLLKCGKSCRLRWLNYLRTDIKRGNFNGMKVYTTDEKELIMESGLGILISLLQLKHLGFEPRCRLLICKYLFLHV